MNLKLNQIAEFLNKYKAFQSKHQQEKINHYKSEYGSLLSGYKKRRISFEARDRKEATRFNIFDILNIKSAETKTHTPFLKNLLDPNGSHAQGDLFLRLFLEIFIPSERSNNFYLKDAQAYRVIEEKNTRFGRIDLFIESKDFSKKFGVVLENKIYAGDQSQQLQRYYQFLTQTKGLSHEQIQMFYLTVDGRSPSDYSIDKKLRDKLKDQGILATISYKHGINEWLDQCIRETEAYKVKALINQYLKTINQL